MKPLLVGEMNPYGADPHFALYPAPEKSAGWRLCVKVMGLPRAEYLRRFDRANLCTGKWSVVAARAEASRLAALDHVVYVLFGKKVCDAFRLDFSPFTVVAPPRQAKRAVILPHPSGLCRAWNEAGAFERARRVLREAGVLLPEDGCAS